MAEVRDGDVIDGRFRLLRMIGAGGMGAVWAAHHERIDRDVAIKLLHPDLAVSPEVRRRFIAEARAVGRLRHPNIVDVVDTGETQDGGLFIVFELLRGESLEGRLEKMGWLGRRASLLIAIEVCRALEMAHRAGIVHRDLKPANVFLHHAPTGVTVVKVLDFGISKLVSADLSMTQAGTVMGTPQYMSAEQARGDLDIDARSDIWSVGALLFEMLTGQSPFDGNNHGEILDKILKEEPPSLHASGRDVPPGVAAIVEKCLVKDRALRFQSAHELRLALEKAEAAMVDSGTDLLKIGRLSYASFAPDDVPAESSVPQSLPSGLAETERPVAQSKPPALASSPPERAGRRWRKEILGAAAVALFVLALFTGRRSKERSVTPAASEPPSSSLTVMPSVPAPKVTASVEPVLVPAPHADPAVSASAAPAAPSASHPLPAARAPKGPLPKRSVAPAASAPPGEPKTKVDNAGF